MAVGAKLQLKDTLPLAGAEARSSELTNMAAIGRLAGGTVHDFNNLLTTIMLYCDLLLAGLKDNKQLYHYAQKIHQAGEYGAVLLQQLMASVRREPVETRMLSWNEAIEEMRTLLCRLVGKNVELASELASDLGHVKMHSAHAHQIILNLVMNARDAMPQGGRIILTTRTCLPVTKNSQDKQIKPVPQIELMVSDTGQGMDEETRQRAFEPFFTTKKPGRGNGLGLMTMSDYIRRLGGSIDVESVPDRGTRVMVRLPRAEVREPANGVAKELERNRGTR